MIKYFICIIVLLSTFVKSESINLFKTSDIDENGTETIYWNYVSKDSLKIVDIDDLTSILSPYEVLSKLEKHDSYKELKLQRSNLDTIILECSLSIEFNETMIPYYEIHFIDDKRDLFKIFRLLTNGVVINQRVLPVKKAKEE